MTRSSNGILAIVVIPCFLVPAMGFGDVAVHAFAAAWTSQNAGQDMGMVWIVDLFPLKGIDLALFLCQIPIFFRNDGLMLSVINGKLRLFDHMHLIACALLLFCPASAVGNLPHVDGIVQHILHKIP